MDQIIVENVRCFRKRQTVPLAPLTFLVGENSSGKSTFLALARLAWDLMASRRPLNFNEEPFSLGAYDQIATLVQRPTTSADSFWFGARVAGGVITDNVTVTTTFVSRGGQPAIRQWKIEDAQYRITLEYDGDEKPSLIKLKGPNIRRELKVDQEMQVPPPYLAYPIIARYFASRGYSSRLLFLFQAVALAPATRPYAFAPIRTRPQRTYDALQEILNPEGSHVPLLLYRLSQDRAAWQRLSKAISGFGRASGLFEKVEVKAFDKEGGPFQIRVAIDGIPTNFVDVGYGVSQILPIVVDCILATEGSTFLLQQPEVHLHPRAQAELSSFLALLAKEGQKQFLIETHSDYMVDRIRMDIRDGKHGLRPEDVLILYFERQGAEAHIHPMTLDSYGNLLDAPATYRRFFLDEERRFLG